MSTDLDIRPDLSNNDTDDNVCHIVCCCSRDIAMCGASVPDNDTISVDDSDEDETCKRCLELESVPCVLCGHDNTSCYCGKCPR